MTQKIQVRPVTEKDRPWIKELIEQAWHAEFVVAHKRTYYPEKLDGFIAVLQDKRVGLITLNQESQDCEIVTLNSLIPSQGIGTALLDSVIRHAGQQQCDRVWLATTNDNLNALRFYQKRGFTMVKIDPHSIDYARKLKPIPITGANGIPIQVEIELEYGL